MTSKIFNYPRFALFLVILISTLVRINGILPEYRYYEFNNDEERNLIIAKNYLSGEGYTLYGKEASFYSSMPVFLYVWYLKNDIPKSWIILSLSIISILLMIPAQSITANFVSRICGGNLWFGVIAAAAFGLYPSNITYIGPLFWYEKVTMPLFVIFIDRINKLDTRNTLHGPILIAILTLVLSIIRNQMLAITTIFMIFIFAWSILMKADRAAFRVAAISILCGFGLTLLCNIPVFKKTKNQFGKPVISTQMGFELMQGHNPLARGSWRRSWTDPGDPYYVFSREVIPGLDDMNELQESEARKNYAIRWALTHPIEEIVLTLRKVAIFFMPINFQGGFHWFNFFVHLAFFPSVIYLILRHLSNRIVVLNLLAIASVLALSIVFFSDMRWRYYAEPFMIIVATTGVWAAVNWIKAKISPSATP